MIVNDDCWHLLVYWATFKSFCCALSVRLLVDFLVGLQIELSRRKSLSVLENLHCAQFHETHTVQLKSFSTTVKPVVDHRTKKTTQFLNLFDWVFLKKPSLKMEIIRCDSYRMDTLESYELFWTGWHSSRMNHRVISSLISSLIFSLISSVIFSVIFSVISSAWWAH